MPLSTKRHGAAGYRRLFSIPSSETEAALSSPDEQERPRVIVVDDHVLFRSGLKLLLEHEGVVVVGEAGTGEAALRLVEEAVPDVVLTDLNMPGMGGIEAIRRLSALAPLVRVVVLTGSAEEEDVAEAILAGANGYLLKDAPVEEVLAGIKAAMAGESWVSPGIAGRFLKRLVTGSQEPGEAVEGRVGRLTAREAEILKCVAAGKDNAQIAAELFLSHKTVKNHVSNILRKLQMQNRIEAALYAIKHGIVEGERRGGAEHVG